MVGRVSSETVAFNLTRLSNFGGSYPGGIIRYTGRRENENHHSTGMVCPIFLSFVVGAVPMVLHSSVPMVLHSPVLVTRSYCRVSFPLATLCGQDVPASQVHYSNHTLAKFIVSNQIHISFQIHFVKQDPYISAFKSIMLNQIHISSQTISWPSPFC